MKKKIFAVALAAAMSITSVFTAFAGEDIDVKDFASAKSVAQKVDSNFEVTYTFHINAYQIGTNPYENVMVEFFTEDETVKNSQSNYLSAVCNGGAWFWNGTDAEAQWTASDGTTDNGSLTCTNTCTDADKTILKDADMTLNIKKDGANYSISGKVGDEEVWTFSVEGNDTFKESKGYLHLSGERVKLTNIEYTNSDSNAEVATPAPTVDPKETTLPDFSNLIDNSEATTAAESKDEKEDSNTWVIVVCVAAVVVVAGVIAGVVVKGKKKSE